MDIRDESARGEAGAVKAFLGGRNDGSKFSTRLRTATSKDRRNRWRERMPDPRQYYLQALDGLRESTDGWFTARCPFHEDRVRSLSVHLGHGGWKCHAGCGSGDLLSFHMRVTGKDFKPAVADLTGARL